MQKKNNTSTSTCPCSLNPHLSHGIRGERKISRRQKRMKNYLVCKKNNNTSTSTCPCSLNPHLSHGIGDSFSLKTYAAISNAHLSRVCKRGKLSGSCLSTINGFGSTQLPIFLCHIGVPTFSWQNKVMKVCPKYLLTSFQNWSSQH